MHPIPRLSLSWWTRPPWSCSTNNVPESWCILIKCKSPSFVQYKIAHNRLNLNNSRFSMSEREELALMGSEFWLFGVSVFAVSRCLLFILNICQFLLFRFFTTQFHICKYLVKKVFRQLTAPTQHCRPLHTHPVRRLVCLLHLANRGHSTQVRRPHYQWTVRRRSFSDISSWSNVAPGK